MENGTLIQLIGLGQAVMIPVGLAVFGWLVKISNDVAKIKGQMNSFEIQKMDSRERHDRNERRLHYLERAVDRCPNCTEKIVVGEDT